MLHEMRMLDARRRALGDAIKSEEQRPVMLAFVTEAERCLAELSRRPSGRDPSDWEHIEQEQRLYESLRRGFGELRAAIASGGELEELVETNLRHAQVLNEEMRREAQEINAALREEGRRVRTAVLLTTGLALLGLILVLRMVWTRVVTPVRSLRDGVQRVAGGDLTHRVEIASKDEIGALARDFNQMADELHGMRSNLEARVEARTQEFLRAARLAGLGTMAAGIAHEINNPLASIASCAEGMERRLSKGTVDAATQREYLQIIAREAYRAHEITSRLLDFARNGAPARIHFDASDLMRELGVLLEHRLRAKALTLEIDCPKDLPQLVGNPTEVKQVLLNLLHNAMDASPERGVVRVRWAATATEFTIEVADQGPGVPQEQRERIFDPFFTTKEPGKGTGLGLAIVHRIVNDHGGRIELVDAGNGALFRVHLPLPTP
jgi:signal transduction histidine kinase